MGQPRRAESRRRLRVLAALAVAVLLAAARGASPAAGVADGDEPLDLAAVTLPPSAVPEEGFGLVGGRWPSLEEEARRLTRERGQWRAEAANALRDALAGAGWRQRYESALAVSEEAAPGRTGASVTSSVARYEDADGAAAAFDLLAPAGAADAGRPARGLIPFGEDSRIVRTFEAGLDEGEPVPRWELTLRRGNLVGAVAAVDYTGERGWGILLVERLAAALLARIEAVLTGGGPGLAPRLLRFAEAGLPPAAFDAYDRLGGATFPLYGVDPVDAADRTALYGGATDVYTHEQELVAGSAPVAYAAKLYRFPDAATAAAWLETAPERFFADPGSFLDLASVEGAATVGEASRTVAFAFPASEEVTTRGYRIYARVGRDVARVQLDGAPEIPLAAVEAVARTQAACLSRPVCDAAPPLPLGTLVPATPAVR